MQSIIRLAALLAVVSECFAFSLLGPFEPWQTSHLGYDVHGNEIGGVKNLGEEYRYNLPILTYGFDRSFIEFFGYPGIFAVDEAIRMIEELPPASEMDLDSFPLHALGFHPQAAEKGLFDLKSAALGLMLEQLGLGNPIPHIWALRDRKTFANPDFTNYLVIRRNFDPKTLEPSTYVNEANYTYEIKEFPNPYAFASAVEIPTVPEKQGIPATELISRLWRLTATRGEYIATLTRDDAGALKYLLDPRNLNPEILPFDVQMADGETNDLVVAAWRPGVDKISFLKITNHWEPPTVWIKEIHFIDRYYDSNFTLIEQRVKRTITRPDIVFSAADLSVSFLATPPNFHFTNWSGATPSPAGPGTFLPLSTITFGTLNPPLEEIGSESESELSLPRWGWFSADFSDVLEFPQRNVAGLASKLVMIQDGQDLVLTLEGFPAPYKLQRSPDLKEWTTIGTLRGNSSTVSLKSFDHAFYRAISGEE